MSAWYKHKTLRKGVRQAEVTLHYTSDWSALTQLRGVAARNWIDTGQGT